MGGFEMVSIYGYCGGDEGGLFEGAAGTRTMGAAGTSKLALGPDRPWSWLGSNFGPFGALFRSATITMKNVK
ncbi:hypothetical protein V6N11_080429 [Hibiscus sabdariffa]|uniref:Uncharacterized protein n=1 Tax=Hibiscus sabdariffa TaxID=183260 RepID=A0ABR2R7P0_9ROSI